LHIALLVGCDNEDWNAEKILPPEEISEGTIQVSAVEVRRGDFYVPIIATGTILPQDESRLGSKIAGRIERITVDEGDYVTDDKEIVRFDRSDIILNRRMAVAELEMAEASLKEAKVNVANLKKEKDRLTSLYKRAVVSEKKYDDINASFSMAVARIDLVSAQIERAKANIALVSQQLKDSVVTSPFSGIVVEKYVNEGEVVSPGTPLVWIMNIARVIAEVGISEVNITQLRKGIVADVSLDALPDYRFQGTISRINARIDPVNRNFTVEIDIPNDKRLIKPGMFVRVTLKTDIHKDVVLVPHKALVTDSEGLDAVFVLKGEKVVSRPVIVGAFDSAMAEIKQGLHAEETVIVSGNYGLEQDTKVMATIVPY
jgi:RND family efflux transporter MFP subunit